MTKGFCLLLITAYTLISVAVQVLSPECTRYLNGILPRLPF